MLNQKETQLVLGQFFNACLKFWWSAGKGKRDAFELAIKDIEGLVSDPYSPQGKLLDVETKVEFIRYKKMDLGK